MKKLLIAGILLLGTGAQAATVIKNDKVINAVIVSTTSSPYNQVLDIGSANSASFQMTATCASGQVKIQQSDDGVSFVDLDVAGSSLTWYGGGLSTKSNQLFSISAPTYRYLNFDVVNSSVPSAGVASNCILTVTECIKSDTVISN